MVAAWGGYVFIINLIPLYTLFLILIGRMDVKIYISYSVFYIIGTILSMQVRIKLLNNLIRFHLLCSRQLRAQNTC